VLVNDEASGQRFTAAHLGAWLSVSGAQQAAAVWRAILDRTETLAPPPPHTLYCLYSTGAAAQQICAAWHLLLLKVARSPTIMGHRCFWWVHCRQKQHLTAQLLSGIDTPSRVTVLPAGEGRERYVEHYR
jgi:hypothetical protein